MTIPIKFGEYQRRLHNNKLAGCKRRVQAEKFIPPERAAARDNQLNVKPAVGFTLPSAGVTSFGFAQDRLCTQC
jgi:hypothetical protein